MTEYEWIEGHDVGSRDPIDLTSSNYQSDVPNDDIEEDPAISDYHHLHDSYDNDGLSDAEIPDYYHSEVSDDEEDESVENKSEVDDEGSDEDESDDNDEGSDEDESDDNDEGSDEDESEDADEESDEEEPDDDDVESDDDDPKEDDTLEIVDKDVIRKIKPELTPEYREQLDKKKKTKLPSFKRQEWFRYKRLGDRWRRPRGLHSKMRRHMGYRPPVVRAGYRTPKDVRYIHPSGFREVLVHNISELEDVDPKVQAVRIGGTVGKRKRKEIIEKADGLNIRVLNRRGL